MSSSALNTDPSKPNSSLRPEPYHHGNLRQALLTSAMDIVEQDGIEALSLREVARRANVSPAAPYHHFKDKASILKELAQIGLAQLAQNSQRSIQKIKNPFQKLNQIGVDYVVYAFEHPNQFKLMFSTDLPQTSDRTVNDPAQSLLLEVLRECNALGQIKIQDEQSLHIAATRSWALVHGLATLIVSGPLSRTVTTKAQVIQLTRQIMGDDQECADPEAVEVAPKRRAKKR
jgi:AcrR family transcriptional regulator